MLAVLSIASITLRVDAISLKTPTESVMNSA
jgi:hypothetical protein